MWRTWHAMLGLRIQFPWPCRERITTHSSLLSIRLDALRSVLRRSVIILEALGQFLDICGASPALPSNVSLHLGKHFLDLVERLRP